MNGLDNSCEYCNWKKSFGRASELLAESLQTILQPLPAGSMLALPMGSTRGRTEWLQEKVRTNFFLPASHEFPAPCRLGLSSSPWHWSSCLQQHLHAVRSFSNTAPASSHSPFPEDTRSPQSPSPSQTCQLSWAAPPPQSTTFKFLSFNHFYLFLHLDPGVVAAPAVDTLVHFFLLFQLPSWQCHT